MNRNNEQVDNKKPYRPPQLTVISLRPEEAVLGHCKIFGQGGVGAASGGVCGITCSTAGS
jgi:hypothetical protein